MVGHCEAGAVKRELGCAALAPVSLAISGVQRLPCQSSALGRRLVGHAFPPHAAVRRQRDVGEDACCAPASPWRSGLVFTDVPGATPKKPASGLMARRRPFGVRLDPGDVVADGPDLPALETVGRNQHREIGLAAGAGEGRRDVGLLALRILHAEDQHVLGHPAFIARDVGGDAQREAFLAQQRVAAVARAVGPDLARLREMHDVLLVVARPGHVASPGASGTPTLCMHGTTRFSSLSISLKHAFSRCAP